ncbi:MAG: hypothetical protein WB676_04550 [Bryobacteraceae bacterium]
MHAKSSLRFGSIGSLHTMRTSMFAIAIGLLSLAGQPSFNDAKDTERYIGATIWEAK